MDCESIILLEDASCVQCGDELAKGVTVCKDRYEGTVFCSEEDWAIHYDVDGAGSAHRRRERESEERDDE